MAAMESAAQPSILNLILIGFSFALMIYLLYSRRLPALITLPLMSVLIAAAAGMPVADILKGVVEGGALKLHGAMIAVIFGAMLSTMIFEEGIAERVIRSVSELAGDDPQFVSVAMVFVCALLFTALGGLGAVIMVASIVLPILTGQNVKPKVAGVLFLFGLSLGGIFNPVNWALYLDPNVLGLEAITVATFAGMFAPVFAGVTLIFIWFNVRGRMKPWKAILAACVLGLLGIGAVLALNPGLMEKAAPLLAWLRLGLWALIGAGLAIAWIAALIQFATRFTKTDAPLPGLAYLAPLIPVATLLFSGLNGRTKAAFIAAKPEGWFESLPAFPQTFLNLEFGIVTSFILGILFLALVSFKPRKTVNTVMKSIFEGFKDAAPAVFLMVGIGMLVKAVISPQVSQMLAPLMAKVTPSSFLPYVIVFTILAPLALFRGPLNIWGMGFGIIALMLKTGQLNAAALMAAFLSTGQLQGVSDPTNTHNVWLASTLKIDVMELTQKSIGWVWVIACMGLILGGILFLVLG